MKPSDVKPVPIAAATETRRKPRKRTVALTTAAVVLAVACGGAWFMTQKSADNPAEKPTVDYATAPVTLGSMSESKVLTGSLLYSGQRTIAAGSAGVVTALPDVGAAIGVGGTLYTIDNRPVLLLHGALPVWRDFASGMTDGPDVQQLETNLQAMGLFTGDVDQKFTKLTSDGIKAWQKALGQERTGVLGRGSIAFSAGDVRVAELKSAVGAGVGEGGEILVVSSAEKIVQVDVKLGDQSLSTVGNPVIIALPDGTSTAGTVSAVGVAIEKTDDQGEKSTSIVIPTTITLADQAAAASFQLATVQVSFATNQREDVLTIPVEALVAIDDKTFGVQLPAKNGTTKTLNVTVGMFAAGRVEVSGDGIVEGLDVVVPKR